MGILANTVSFCQFRVLGDLPKEDFFPWASKALAGKGFRPIDHNAEELSIGWAHLDNMQESDFEAPQVCWRDHYLVFSLRRDQRRLPSALVKTRFEQAQQAYLDANPGMQRLGKQKKEELKDAVKGALLAKTLPAPSVWDAVWDTRSGLVTFSCCSPKVVELFETLFTQTFTGLRLVAYHPFARAEQVLDEPGQQRLQATNEATSDTVLDLIQDNLWLGRDFFRWLLFQTLHEASSYRVSQDGPALEGEEFAGYLNDRLVLLGGGSDGLQKITVAGPQDAFSEVCAALRGGKEICEAVLHLEKGEHAWRLSLKGETFQFASFKAPAVRLEKDGDVATEKEALFYERMHVLEEGLQLFDSLYAAFLEERLGAEWGKRDAAMREALLG